MSKESRVVVFDKQGWKTKGGKNLSVTIREGATSEDVVNAVREYGDAYSHDD